MYCILKQTITSAVFTMSHGMECKDLAPNGYGVTISRGLLGHIERRFKPLLEIDSRAKDNEILASRVRKLIGAELEKLDLQEEMTHHEQLEDPLDIPSRTTSVMNKLDLFLVDNDRSL
uniref:Uncharacterized protein n=1 Tax=Daphnia galeata TaxID=27404 RepID=A0A8J2WQZ4_9CRUS|nr:unnamed protein product [Daphnia galeata]